MSASIDRARVALALTICLLAALSTSCLVRRRVITRQGGDNTRALLTADKARFIKWIDDRYQATHSFSATVDMVPAIGSVNKGKVTEYKDVRAYILFSKPSKIRIIGLYPVVRTKAFDMTSNGSRFELYIPSKNRFIVGSNDVDVPSKKKLENLRPQHFLDAMVVRPVNTSTESAVLENLTDEDDAVYILHVLRTHDGRLYLARNLWFDRSNLNLVRQQIFDLNGDILTDARYSDWQTFNGVRFPRRIDINRPLDEYGVVVTVVKLEMNQPLGEDKFALERPPGAELTVLGNPPAEGDGNRRANGDGSSSETPSPPAGDPPKEQKRNR